MSRSVNFFIILFIYLIFIILFKACFCRNFLFRHFPFRHCGLLYCHQYSVMHVALPPSALSSDGEEPLSSLIVISQIVSPQPHDSQGKTSYKGPILLPLPLDISYSPTMFLHSLHMSEIMFSIFIYYFMMIILLRHVIPIYVLFVHIWYTVHFFFATVY